MTQSRRGILAVWNDRDADIADFYEDWYVHQHLPERVGLPGWRFGRRYESIVHDAALPTLTTAATATADRAARFFTYYETDEPSAMYSDSYLSRLNDPTLETVQVMHHWRNMTRSSCELAFKRTSALTDSGASLCGQIVCVARFSEACLSQIDSTQRETLMVGVAASQLAGTEEQQKSQMLPSSTVLAAQCWMQHTAPRLNTTEANVRGRPDTEIAAAIVLDCMRVDAAQLAAERLNADLAGAGLTADTVEIFQLLCEYRS